MKKGVIFLLLIVLGWAAGPGRGQAREADAAPGASVWQPDEAPPSDAEMCDWASLALGGDPCPR